MSRLAHVWDWLRREVLKPTRSALADKLTPRTKDSYRCSVLLSPLPTPTFKEVTVGFDTGLPESSISLDFLRDILHKENEIQHCDGRVMDTPGGSTDIIGRVVLTLRGGVFENLRDVRFNVYINKSPTEFGILIGEDVGVDLGVSRLSASPGYPRRETPGEQGGSYPSTKNLLPSADKHDTVQRAQREQEAARAQRIEDKKKKEKADIEAAYQLHLRNQRERPGNTSPSSNANNTS